MIQLFPLFTFQVFPGYFIEKILEFLISSQRTSLRVCVILLNVQQFTDNF